MRKSLECLGKGLALLRRLGNFLEIKVLTLSCGEV
jgi:hypothetical protein